MDCFLTFRFTADMTREFNGDDRFVPVNYLKDWAVVREVDAVARKASEEEAAKQQGTPR